MKTAAACAADHRRRCHHRPLRLFFGVGHHCPSGQRRAHQPYRINLFAKPLPRHSFLLWQGLGILGLLGLCVLIIALWHLAVMWFAQQQGFDLEERMRSYHSAEDVGYMPWLGTLAAHCLGAFGNMALCCLATVLSLRFGFGITLLCTFGAFILAHRRQRGVDQHRYSACPEPVQRRRCAISRCGHHAILFHTIVCSCGTLRWRISHNWYFCPSTSGHPRRKTTRAVRYFR